MYGCTSHLKVNMAYALVTLFLSFVVDGLVVRGKTATDKDLEILVLRHQLRILQRKTVRRPRLSRPEKVLLAVLAVRFRTRVKGVGAPGTESAVIQA